YKLLEKNAGCKSSFTFEHEEYIQNLLDEDSQLYTEDVINNLSKHFMEVSISKTQLIHRFEKQHTSANQKAYIWTPKPEALSAIIYRQNTNGSWNGKSLI
ncbi:uncharacterized protein BX663DRAFT_440023, partial [Cokeromyces recurvatus]|uniref:uncharacterized protein n=1 Tax=Cokeromyces recurvatus TaxID=90255 RepID=UPI00221EB2AD